MGECRDLVCANLALQQNFLLENECIVRLELEEDRLWCGGLSMAAWGLLDGLQSRHGEPPASFAQPFSQCHALSQAPVRIQGLCQMLAHSFHFSSL